MTARQRANLRIKSSILLNIGAGLLSSLLLYVSLTESGKVAAELGWIVVYILVTATSFESGRALAFQAEFGT